MQNESNGALVLVIKHFKEVAAVVSQVQGLCSHAGRSPMSLTLAANEDVGALFGAVSRLVLCLELFSGNV